MTDPKKIKMLGLIHKRGSEVEEARVEIEGSLITDPRTGNKYQLIGAPRVRVKRNILTRVVKREPVILLSDERACSFEPPKGHTIIPLGDTDQEFEFAVTPGLFLAAGVEASARALQKARKMPTMLVVAWVLGGVGLGWIIRMIFEIIKLKMGGTPEVGGS